jgi:hypothetical protein
VPKKSEPSPSGSESRGDAEDDPEPEGDEDEGDREVPVRRLGARQPRPHDYAEEEHAEGAGEQLGHGIDDQA